ncbi:hypothetical protein HDU76_004701, partial [Blyttiomyces sp. JEL0837]
MASTSPPHTNTTHLKSVNTQGKATNMTSTTTVVNDKRTNVDQDHDHDQIKPTSASASHESESYFLQSTNFIVKAQPSLLRQFREITMANLILK